MNCLIPCCAGILQRTAGVTSPVCAESLGGLEWRRWVAHTSVSPSRFRWLSPRERVNLYNLEPVSLQELPEGSAVHLPFALGAPLRI